jgi:hypothetical protein
MERIYRVYDITKTDLCDYALKKDIQKLTDSDMKVMANGLRNAIVSGTFIETAMVTLLHDLGVETK